jgi:hypothetical protein
MNLIEIKDVPSNTTTQLTITKVALERLIPASISDTNSLVKTPVNDLIYTNF